MPTIRQLSSSVINKIAAGEVIERPASIVKELMENSIDAGASRIDVSVEQGGLELVRVSDDGCGIAADELPLAVASHATSKITEGDDLFSVATLGFRGEALASMAEVSRLVLRTRPASAMAGAQLEVSGGHSLGVTPCGCPQGTTIEVRQLFYNTPVRRKFLRGTQTEMGHIGEAFTRIALAYPQVHCTLRHNDRQAYDLPPAADWRERIGTFFGADLARDLIAVSSDDGQIRLEGFVANPTHSRANARMQYLFLNGRAIRDRALQHALGEAYRGLLLVGRYPIAFLRIFMPPDLVDVNVHPTKLEVRLQESGRVYSQLLGTIRSKFLSTDLTARVQTPVDESGAAAHDPRRAQQLRQELVDWAKGQLNQARAADSGDAVAQELVSSELASTSGSQASLPWTAETRAHAPLELVSLGRRWQPVGEPDEEVPGGGSADDAAATLLAKSGLPGGDFSSEGSSPDGMPRADITARADGAHAPVARPLALQVHNRYLITESSDGMVVIDQHALHERIIYEHLRERVLAGALETQRLLVPEPVDLSPAEAAAVLGARDVLAQLGVTVEPFGGDTVLMASYPAMLAQTPAAEILRELVDHLLSGGQQPERRDLLDELLHMISCKAAIKAGDPLSAAEIATLLEQRHLAQDTHHCPHGRPTALIFTRDELDRQFKRKG